MQIELSINNTKLLHGYFSHFECSGRYCEMAAIYIFFSNFFFRSFLVHIKLVKMSTQ